VPVRQVDEGEDGPVTLPLFGIGRREVGPGAVHLPGWLDADRQRRLAAACLRWAAGPVPARHTLLPGGHRMSARTVCLGWHWQPYRYSRTADDVNGEPVAPLPGWLAEWGRAALAEAYRQPDVDYRPDTALVNFYDADARMGMHQDSDEKAREPVVSFSLGDSCLFRFGNTENRSRPYTDLTLASGDAFVFGGESRLAYHGVVRIEPGSSPDPALPAGRINLTLRATGLA
jgi:alkylated DNA repair protein (DNA oxidative demethylase)